MSCVSKKTKKIFPCHSQSLRIIDLWYIPHPPTFGPFVPNNFFSGGLPYMKGQFQDLNGLSYHSVNSQSQMRWILCHFYILFNTTPATQHKMFNRSRLNSIKSMVQRWITTKPFLSSPWWLPSWTHLRRLSANYCEFIIEWLDRCPVWKLQDFYGNYGQ